MLTRKSSLASLPVVMEVIFCRSIWRLGCHPWRGHLHGTHLVSWRSFSQGYLGRLAGFGDQKVVTTPSRGDLRCSTTIDFVSFVNSCITQITSKLARNITASVSPKTFLICFCKICADFMRFLDELRGNLQRDRPDSNRSPSPQKPFNPHPRIGSSSTKAVVVFHLQDTSMAR